MSDTYNYANGAVHHDHHRSITINGASGRDLQALLKAFMAAEAEEVSEVEASPQPKARKRDSSGEINLSSSQPTLLSRRPKGEEAAGIAVPEVLLTDKARALHARLCEAGMIDAEWQPVGLSFTEKGTLIDYLAERLDIRAKWKFFGALWHTDPETLRTSKARGLDQDKTWAFRSRLDAL